MYFINLFHAVISYFLNNTNNRTCSRTRSGTDDIYAVHAAGDDDVATNLTGNDNDGYRRLSRLNWGTEGPELDVLTTKVMAQTRQYCHLPRAASVYVKAGHSLQFYCHARNVDTPESDLGVIK